VPSRTIPLDRPLDLRLTLAPHLRGTADPAMRLARDRAIRATRTADGPATIALTLDGERLHVEAWGPGADRALDGAPALAGVEDGRDGFAPADRLLADLDRRMPGLRIGRSGAVLEALIPAILEQKVTGAEARRAYRGIIARWGETAPGPFGLRLLPPPETLARLPYEAFHPIGLERRRADLIRSVALRAARFEEIVDLPLPDAYRRLTALPGLGPWTAAEVALRALGDPDAVSVGDYHIPNMVGFALAGERKATDARMLELLAPYRGQRGRVIRLLEASGIRPPARGPRMSPRSIAAI
jgi:3-methyladenine DNA glycosylase/8-oxoguanine DNA glycosylase